MKLYRITNPPSGGAWFGGGSPKPGHVELKSIRQDRQPMGTLPDTTKNVIGANILHLNKRTHKFLETTPRSARFGARLRPHNPTDHRSTERRRNPSSGPRNSKLGNTEWIGEEQGGGRHHLGWCRRRRIEGKRRCDDSNVEPRALSVSGSSCSGLSASWL